MERRTKSGIGMRTESNPLSIETHSTHKHGDDLIREGTDFIHALAVRLELFVSFFLSFHSHHINHILLALL